MNTGVKDISGGGKGIFKGTDVQLDLPRKVHRLSMTGICGLEGE